ncbi:MAG TPA: hypothetical protein VF519_07380 [Mycobacteriales bacterium]|jgi:hypothetical protein
MSATRAAVAAAALALAAAPIAAPLAHAQVTDGPTLVTGAASGSYRLDAACHFGPMEDTAVENRLYVTGAATAPGALSTTVRCVVESGNGVWRDVHGATLPGPAAAVSGRQYVWVATYDRVCVEAEADFGDGLVLVAPPTCA